MTATRPAAIVVTGLGGASVLGSGVDGQVAALGRAAMPLRPLADHPDCDGVMSDLLAGWIEDRSWLAGRKYGAAANASIRAAREAIAEAGWGGRALTDCHVFTGTSRGNSGELLNRWKFRRPFRKLAASNTMHSETASAVSVALGIRGPWTCLSNGCSSGLDALALAWQSLALGLCERALVIGVDLPLIPELLECFAATGLLSSNNVNDPYSDRSSGFLPGEAVAALALEVGSGSGPRILGALANSDAHDNVAPEPTGSPTENLISGTLGLAGLEGRRVTAVIPHANGTVANGEAELAAIRRVFRTPGRSPVSLHLMKPWTGHSLGASGLLECLLLCAFLREGRLPPNLPGLTCPDPVDLPLPSTSQRMEEDACVLKVSTAMGGRNTAVALGLAS